MQDFLKIISLQASGLSSNEMLIVSTIVCRKVAFCIAKPLYLLALTRSVNNILITFETKYFIEDTSGLFG